MPLVLPALSLAAGIAAAPWAVPRIAWPLLLGALLWCASLVVLGRLGCAVVCLLLGVAAAGALRAADLPPAADHLARQALPVLARLEGRLVREPVRLAPDRTRLVLDAARLDGQSVSGRVHVTAYGADLPPLTEGQRMEAPVALHRAAGFRNPGGFDYADFLRREGVLVVGTTRAERLTALDQPRPPWHVRARHAAREATARALPPASAALLRGLLLGDRTDLPRDVDEAFRRAGVYHVLAVSGFNVALVGGAVWALLTIARGGRRLATVGAMAAIVVFALVVGPEPSVLRAVVMSVLVLGALLLDREASLVNSLALAALAILLVRPGDLLDPGFQLSFAATGAIVLTPLPRGLALGALGVSVAAQLGVLPIALVHFNQLSTLGPVANLAAVPLAGAATVLGLLALTLAFVTDTGADVLLNAAWPVLLALRAVVTLMAAVPGALLRLPAPHWTAIVAYALGLALALVWWRLRDMGGPEMAPQTPHAGAGRTPRAGDGPGDRAPHSPNARSAPAKTWRFAMLRSAPDRARWAGAGAVVFLALALAIGAWPLLRPADGRLRVTVLDVGQGDAIVIETPDGQAVLIDAGSGGPRRLDAGDRVVAPFLWNRGVLRLAATATTHDDRDHAGGMAAIRRHFTIGEPLGPAAQRWIGGVSVQAIFPQENGPGRGRRNDEALVLRVDHGLASFLLASDIDGAVEARLVGAGAPLTATVLKVAHHGSRRSSTGAFLQAVRPAFAVISVGARNSYGHPAAETLERLAASGARTYRTDRDGAVLFESDGATLSVTRWASRQTERYCLDPDGIC